MAVPWILKTLGKATAATGRGFLGGAKSAYRAGPIKRMFMGAAIGGAAGAIAEDGGLESRLAGGMRGATMGAAAGLLTSALRPMAKKAWELAPGPRQLASSAWNTMSSLGRIGMQHPGPALLTAGAAGLALSVAPFASDVHAQINQQKYASTVARSYSTEGAVLQAMRQGMVYPSPGTGPVPSLRDRFANSTTGLVQGLHAGRLS